MKIRTGSVTGTTAAIEITCGFIPKIVKVFNGDSGVTVVWNDAMPAASGIKTVGAGTTDYISTGGITKGTVKTFLGFTIGADADLNTAHTLYWEALCD